MDWELEGGIHVVGEWVGRTYGALLEVGLAEQTAPIDAVYDTPHLTCSSVQHFACGLRQLRKQSHPQR